MSSIEEMLEELPNDANVEMYRTFDGRAYSVSIKYRENALKSQSGVSTTGYKDALINALSGEEINPNDFLAEILRTEKNESS